MSTMSQIGEMVKELRLLGVTLEKRGDENGQNEYGWWLDGAWIAPANKPKAALKKARRKQIRTSIASDRRKRDRRRSKPVDR